MSLIPEWMPTQDSSPSQPTRRTTSAPQQLSLRGTTPAPPQREDPHRPNHTRPYDVRPDANRERDDRNG
jgi:hypothetical protein